MRKDIFFETLSSIRKIDDFCDSACKLGIDMIDSDISSHAFNIAKQFFISEYGLEGYDWMSWYLYEKPDDGQAHAWDENGEPLDLSTDEKLWEYLENNHKQNINHEQV